LPIDPVALIALESSPPGKQYLNGIWHYTGFQRVQCFDWPRGTKDAKSTPSVTNIKPCTVYVVLIDGF
jgi:hypothetical protein